MKTQKFARLCSITMTPINEGYVVPDLLDDMYFRDVFLLIDYLKLLNWVDANGKKSTDIKNEEDLLDYFWNEGVYYWTEWNPEEEDIYYDYLGNVYENI